MAVEAVHETPARADPLIQEPADDGLYREEMDYPAHIRTWNRFIHMLKWFIIHLVCVAVALYFFLVASLHFVGVFMLICAAVALGYGFVSIGRIGPDAGADPANHVV